MNKSKKAFWGTMTFINNGASIVTIVLGYDQVVTKLSQFIEPTIAEVALVLNLLTWPVFILFPLYILTRMLLSHYLTKIGTHGIPCSLVAAFNYKVANRNNKLFDAIHKDIYHNYHRILADLKQHRINDYAEGKAQIENFLSTVHCSIYKSLRIDFTINIKRVYVNRNDDRLCLCPFVHYRGLNGRNVNETRDFSLRYHIQTNAQNNLTQFTAQAKNHLLGRNHADGYEVNSIFSFLLTQRLQKSWMSNDLKNDIQNGVFFTSSSNCLTHYNSLAAFALTPPDRCVMPSGIIIFDSKKTGVFSEKECTNLFGYLAHLFYELIEELKKYENK